MPQTERVPVADHRVEHSAPGIAEATSPLDALLLSFQVLQTKMAHMAASIASSLGIGESDLHALIFIANTGGATPKQTGDFVVLSSGAVTNLIDRLVAADLAQRVPNPNDRRSVTLSPTPAGAAAVESVADLFRLAFANSVRPEQFARLTASFDAIGDSLTRTAAQGFAGRD